MASSSHASPSESRARLLREMSQSLREARSSPLPHPSSIGHDNSNTLPTADVDLDLDTQSSFNPAQDDVPESTRHQGFDDTTQPITNMRSSAARFKYWQPQRPEPRIDTSQIQQEFQDFSDSNEIDESRSIEIGRGQSRSNRNTPRKSLGDMSPNGFSIGNDSLYNLSETARNKSRPTPRKSDGADRVNLRRDAQLRRASSLPQKDLENIAARLGGRNSERLSPKKASSRPSAAAIHAKLAEEDDSFLERPPTQTFTVKNPRFGKARQASGIALNDTPSQTPQKSVYATPRSAAPGTGTHQSFMLPDLPNLTELVSGTFKDGTPVFSRNARSRSRFASAPIPSRLREETTTKHMPVDNVPIPSEEKALYTSLQLLKDKLMQMEQEKAEADKKIEDYETQVAGLRAELTAQEDMRRSDSALGSTDGEGNKRDNWKVEKNRLQSQVDSLRSRLERAERKNSVNEIATKRVTEERDNAVTQLGVAFFNAEEIKTERDELLVENDNLRQEIEALRAENDELHGHLAQYENHPPRQQRGASRKDTAIGKENEALQAETKKAQAVKAEQAKLKTESDALKAQIAQMKAQRQEDIKQRKDRESELRERINRRDDNTIQSHTGLNGEDANGILRDEIAELRLLVTELQSQRDEDAKEWARKEDRLRRKVEKSRNAVREMQDTKELPSVRRSTSQRRASREEATENGTRTFDSRQRRTSSSRRRSELPTSRSNSKPRSVTIGPQRSVSDPQSAAHHDADDETESTTDLSAFTHSRNATPIMHGAVPGLAKQTQEATGDTTELSFMGRDEIARLRRMLEEERAAARKRSRSASRTRQAKDDTVQSMPRKSSMKDLTSASRPMDLTEANTGRILSANTSEPASPVKDATQQSARSESNSRRRRSAPVEMTSAFIIPDITVNPQSMPSTIEQHNDANCTVCRKTTCSDEHEAPINIPQPVPVSERMPDDVDATMRPSQPAPLALATVIKQLNDELNHLLLQKAAYDSLLRNHDPSLGRRKRKDVEAKITELLQAISAKNEQIYNLYDVVEGQKAAGQLNEADAKEFEETLLSVGIDPEEMREKTQKAKGKRVVINDREKDSEIGGLTDDDELPWEGISDTESLSEFNSSAGWKRRAVY